MLNWRYDTASRSACVMALPPTSSRRMPSGTGAQPDTGVMVVHEYPASTTSPTPHAENGRAEGGTAGAVVLAGGAKRLPPIAPHAVMRAAGTRVSAPKPNCSNTSSSSAACGVGMVGWTVGKLGWLVGWLGMARCVCGGMRGAR
jgi:hypothetical protein